MVGKVPEKVKPTIMIVSEDKPRRKAAFQIVRTRSLLANYPGFELGHCSVAAEFEDLRQLGYYDPSLSETISLASTENPEHVQHLDDGDSPGDEILSLLSAEVCAFEWPDQTRPTRLYFHTPSNSHSHNSASATCGGLFNHEGELYALTMAHAIHPTRRTIMSPEQWKPQDDSLSESDDLEITGMDDWDEDDEGDAKTLTAITSPGSRTPSDASDSEESQLKRYDSQRSSEISIRPQIATVPPTAYEADYTYENDYLCEDYFVEYDYDDDGFEEDVPVSETCERIGSVVSVDEVLDIALIKIPLGRSTPDVLYASAGLKLMAVMSTVDDPADTSITVRTAHHAEIKGHRSESPFYALLPGTANFLELHSVQLSTPLRPGDSGSWAFNNNGILAGFVVAGSPKTGSCLLIPAGNAFKSMFSLLESRQRPARRMQTGHSANLPMANLRLDAHRDSPDEDAMTVASSLPPPSIFSYRMDRGTPSTTAYSTTTTPYERNPKIPHTQGSLSRGDAGLTSSFAGKGDFWKEQSTRLRRELERAWEIIGEKDQRLQALLSGDLTAQAIETSSQTTTPLHPEDHLDNQLGFGQDLMTQGSSQLDPAEPSSFQTTFTFSRAASPETPNVGFNPLTFNPEATRLHALAAELAAQRSLVKQTKEMWRAQVDANEALARENNELRSSIFELYDSLPHLTEVKVPRIGSDLVSRLRGSGLSYGTTGSKPELESIETELADIPPHSDNPIRIQPSRFNRQTKGLSPDISGRERRILIPKSRLAPPLSASRTQSSLLSESGRVINTVLEVDEDDEKD
jgi:hypothetical protein